MRDVVVPLLAGAAGGALVGFGVWWFAQSRMEEAFGTGSEALAAEMGIGQDELQRRFVAGREQLRAELAQQISAEVPMRVQATIQTTLANYGITKERARAMSRVLTYAEQHGWV